MGPISPNEVHKKVPEVIFEIVNELIKESWNGDTAIVWQGEVVQEASVRLEMTNSQIYDKRWMDIEGNYEERGWKVVYNKPLYYETWLPYFKFTKGE